MEQLISVGHSLLLQTPWLTVGHWSWPPLQRLAHLSRRGEEMSYAEAMEDWLQNRIDAVNLTDRLDVPSHGTLRAAYRALQTSFARRSRSAE